MTDITFAGWLWARGRRAYTTLFLASTSLASAAPWILNAAGVLPWRWVPCGLHFLHAAVALILLLFLMRPIVPDSTQQRSTDAIQQLRPLWIVVWGIWALLYLLFGVEALLHELRAPAPHSTTWESAFSLVLTFLNNAQTVFLVLCYFVLAEPSLTAEIGGDRVRYRGALAVPIAFAIVLLLVVTAVEGVLLLAAPQPEKAQFWVKFLSGIAACIGLALFIGRLESKFVNARWPVFLLLYLYAAIQPAFALFRDPLYPWLQEAITLLAMFLKLLLFALVYWLVYTRRLHFYMTSVHTLSETVENRLQAHIAPEVLAESLASRGGLDVLNTGEFRKKLEAILKLAAERDTHKRELRELTIAMRSAEMAAAARNAAEQLWSDRRKRLLDAELYLAEARRGLKADWEGRVSGEKVLIRELVDRGILPA